jgi:PPOX class probable F420-dependent enzyme
MPVTVTTLESLDRSWTVLLTTYRRNGTPVPTPVNLAVDGDRAFFRTYSKAGKTKRLKHNPRIELAPCTVRGRPTGPEVTATARLLEGPECTHARAVIARRHPVFQRFVIPFGHKVSRYTTLHYEVVLDAP